MLYMGKGAISCKHKHLKIKIQRSESTGYDIVRYDYQI